jgi:putative endonuclease
VITVHEIDGRSSVGATGERLAAEYLTRSGYRLVVSNFKVPVGRNTKGVQVTGEIDLIALDGETLCFIEVKSRTSESFAPAISAVDLRKQRQITRTARVYRRVFGITDMAFRFDVVTVVDGDEPKVEHIRNYWTEAKFRKQRWHNEFASS